MSEDEPEIRQAVIDWVAVAGGGRGGHPDAETLAAYHTRELPEEDERRIQDHLLVCCECAELLLDLERLGEPDFGRDVEIPAGTEEDLWERLRQEIRCASQSEVRISRPAPSGAAPLPFPPRRTAPPRWMSALAAALLAVVIGLSVWVAALRQTVADLSRPEVNAPVLDLVPLGIGQRDEEAAPDAEVPSGTMFTLILSPAQRGDFQDYEAEIAPDDSEGGAVVWRARGLRPNDYGSFSLTVPRRALDAGAYRIRLFGIGGGSPREPRESLGEYALRVAP